MTRFLISLAKGIGAWVLHLFAAVNLSLIGAVVLTFLLTPFLRHARWQDSWYDPVVWLPSLLAGYLVNRYLGHRSACMVWLAGVLWIAAAVEGRMKYHLDWEGAWSDVRAEMSHDRGMRSDEGLGEAVLVWPLVLSIGYSVGSIGGLLEKTHRRVGTKSPTG